jgi:cytoskeleton protein RodZ
MAATAAPVAEQTVIVAFREKAWTEIRDRDGRVLLTGIYAKGTAQTVSGAPPFTIKIGNAGEVTLRYKGERVDLAPYTQKNVARLTLP